MLPLKLDSHNRVFEGAGVVGDLSVYEKDGVVYSHWEVSPAELRALEDDAVIEQAIHIGAHGLPPSSLAVVSADHEHKTAVISIDDNEHVVEPEIAAEIEALRRERVVEVKEFDPKDDSTILVTIPPAVSGEFARQVGEMAKLQFPRCQIAVLPEDLGLHTKDGFAQLLNAGEAMKDAIMGGGDPVVQAEAVVQWKKATGQ